MESQVTGVRHRLTKADKLLARAEFVRLTTHAPKLANRQFIVFFEKSKHQKSRIGITVSRRVGNAVKRNRIKRLAREYFRLNNSFFKKPWDIHVIAKKEAADGCGQIIYSSLEKLFRRIESSQNE
ncbi:MAG: ribonuclease P protein component [Desulfobacteraceae bacterium]|nr:MAG: ribonuclease P protein component [Desulfobacteraceae bacterium]